MPNSKNNSLKDIFCILLIIALIIYLLIPYFASHRPSGIRTDIANLENALQAYKLVYGVFPPDGMDLGGIPDPANPGKTAAQGGCGTLTSGECIVYFLGNTFTKTPDLAKGEVYATESGGEHMDHFSKQQLKDYDNDVPIPENKTAYYAGEEFTDVYFVRYHYDNIADDPDPKGDGVFNDGGKYVSMGQDEKIVDPRTAAGNKAQNRDFDIWSAGSDPTDPADDVTNWSEK